MLSIRTDLAIEAFENTNAGAIPGIQVSRRETDGILTTEVHIKENEAARKLGKPRGKYLTLESPLLRDRDPQARMKAASLLAQELTEILPKVDPRTPVLVVGLGNRSITPDSLGPGVVDRVLVTRHMSGLWDMEGLHSVCAISPGVLGITGIESMEIVEAVTRSLKPGFILCVDSLAARDSRRIGSTIQITDTGIQPGGGVGNRRRALTQQSVGAPVISIGMPTVIYAATLARDAFAWLSLHSGDDMPHDEALEEMEKTLLSADIGEMIVTPREIDSIVQDAAGMIASGINRALQPSLSEDEIAAMMD